EVVDHRAVKQALVPVLKSHHEDVLFQVGGLAPEVAEHAGLLFLLGKNAWRQEAAEVQRIPFRLGEGRALVEARVVKQIAAAAIRFRAPWRSRFFVAAHDARPPFPTHRICYRTAPRWATTLRAPRCWHRYGPTHPGRCDRSAQIMSG